MNLRPGDLITEDTHTLVYIGNGYVLDCIGEKYKITTGIDKVESKGAVRKKYTVEETLTKCAESDYIITRPLDYYAKDYDGNPGNDILKYNGEFVEITEATKSRQQYPAMEIDRTVDITPYGTAEKNGTLTYSVKISNKTSETVYKSWRKVLKQGYGGEDYKGITVTEVVPEGTAFVSASEGYTLNNGVLSWTIDIPAGNSVEITYTVMVTAEVGSIVTSEGGTVASIPSNSISNKVGYSKLSKEKAEILLGLAESNVDEWYAKYGSDLSFAESIYKEMGITLELSKVEDIIENLFTPTLMEKQTSFVLVYPDNEVPMVMYMPREEVSEEFKQIQNMIVNKYIGGYRLFTVDLDKIKNLDLQNFDFHSELDNMIMECKFDYLEVGDILVYATAKNRGDTDLTSELASTRVLVYVGNETFVEMSSEGVGAVLVGNAANEVLSTSFKSTNDLFFLLRPSQVTDFTK